MHWCKQYHLNTKTHTSTDQNRVFGSYLSLPLSLSQLPSQKDQQPLHGIQNTSSARITQHTCADTHTRTHTHTTHRQALLSPSTTLPSSLRYSVPQQVSMYHLAAASVSTTGLFGSSYSRRNSSADSPALLSTVLRRTHSGLMAAVAQWCGWNNRSEKNPDTFFFARVRVAQIIRFGAGGRAGGRVRA